MITQESNVEFQDFFLPLAMRASISDDWSSTGMMEAAAELDGNFPEREKHKEKRDKERQRERAKVEKEKESDDGEIFTLSF